MVSSVPVLLILTGLVLPDPFENLSCNKQNPGALSINLPCGVLGGQREVVGEQGRGAARSSGVEHGDVQQDAGRLELAGGHR